MYIQPTEKTKTKSATAAFYPQEIKKPPARPLTMAGPTPANKQVARDN
jgi:hypothetical protein